MITPSKKLISLFLVFSLMMLSANLYAKERRGAKLIITKEDWQQIEGELITVKPDSLLLLDIEGKDVSVSIADIRVIRIVKKSKALLGAGIGLLIGGVHGTLVGIRYEDPIDYGVVVGFGVLYGAVYMVLGALLGAGFGKDEKIQIEGQSDSEIQETMDKLSKKARIRDYK
jgi:hypothetical protein